MKIQWSKYEVIISSRCSSFEKPIKTLVGFVKMLEIKLGSKVTAFEMQFQILNASGSVQRHLQESTESQLEKSFHWSEKRL